MQTAKYDKPFTSKNSKSVNKLVPKWLQIDQYEY